VAGGAVGTAVGGAGVTALGAVGDGGRDGGH
jgi:hypothetical protein